MHHSGNRQRLRDVLRAGGSNLDLPLLATIYNAPTGTQPRFLTELLDLEAPRLADMDRNGVARQIGVDNTRRAVRQACHSLAAERSTHLYSALQQRR